MKVAVKDLRPNPFRDLERYPIDEEKVAALIASIKDTSFWDNLVARPSPNGSNGFELAYGVHRLRALEKAGVDVIDIPVRKLDDTTMMKIMAHENQSEWAASALVAQETIRAIVKAFAEGKITLPTVGKAIERGRIRIAPAFTPTGDGDLNSEHQEFKYTAATIAKFLAGEKAGWPESKVEAILATLATVETGLVERNDLEGLSTHQAEMVARQARRVVKETGGDTTLAKAIGKRLAGGMRTATGRSPARGGRQRDHFQSVTYHGAARAADEMMAHRRKTTPKKMPDIEKFAEKIVADLAAVPTDKMKEKIKALVQYRASLHDKTRQRLIGALRGLAKRADGFAEKLAQGGDR